MLPMRTKATMPELLLDGAGFKDGNTQNTMIRNQKAQTMLIGTGEGLQEIAAFNRTEVMLPAPRMDIREWMQDFSDQFDERRFGRCHYTDNNDFHYFWYEEHKKPGFWKNEFEMVRHDQRILASTHKVKRLPVTERLPPKAQRIHDIIMKHDPLRKAVRFHKGFMIGENAETLSVSQEDTMFAKGVKTLWSGTTAAAVGAGAAAWAISSAVAKAAGSMAAAAAADPCFTLGDVVLFGWKEE